MAASTAIEFARFDACAAADLGESQAFQVNEALKLYHFVNAKLLLFTSVVKLALSDELLRPEAIASDPIVEQRIVRAVPPDMYPMAMVEEQPDDAELREIFEDIMQTLSLQSVNSDYRTMALWPSYLKPMWKSLKPITKQETYLSAVDRLRQRSRELARKLPLPIELSGGLVEKAGADVDKAIETTDSFERLLPGLVINIAICRREFEDDEQCSKSSWPASFRSTNRESVSSQRES